MPAVVNGTAAGAVSSMKLARWLLIAALLLMPLQVVQFSIAQPIHLWFLAALCVFALQRDLSFLTKAEILAYLVFIYFALTTTLLQDFGRVKHQEQILKFMVIYPGIFVIGRWIGTKLAGQKFPFGYVFLFGLLAFEYVVQTLALPVLYRANSFGQGALHGTFIERNWLAVYFLFFSYALLLTQKGNTRFIPFFALNGAVMVLSGSKTAFIACGVIYLVHAATPVVLKIIPAVLGAFAYMTVFSSEFTADRIAVRLEEERGLALQAAGELIANNPLGYGFGFVESYFSNLSLFIRGLGEGTNSVFSVPLDLMIIGGVAGLLFWLVLFVGIGTRAIMVMLPVATLTLLNPLHQSEIVYFFAGLLISMGRSMRGRARAETEVQQAFSRRGARPSFSAPSTSASEA